MDTKKRRGAKTPANDYARANLRLDAEVYRRLMIASVMEGRPAGEIASRLLADSLKRWSLPSDLSARGKITDRRDGTDIVSMDSPVAA